MDHKLLQNILCLSDKDFTEWQNHNFRVVTLGKQFGFSALRYEYSSLHSQIEWIERVTININDFRRELHVVVR